MWLGLQDPGRTESTVGEVISAIRAQERDLIAHSATDLTDDDLVAALASVDGLRVAVCRRVQPVDPVAASALPRREVAGSPAT